VGDVVDNFCTPRCSPLLSGDSAVWRFFDQAVGGAAQVVDDARLSSIFSGSAALGADYPLNLLMILLISW
jgi:hypothetical protein